ncbi:MAG TPA: hypothetical protein PLI42_01805 [Candidatus Pacearchaeota archaeon]|nr:hypothetical protein [Candidatus Pacearchaeota archaeon]
MLFEPIINRIKKLAEQYGLHYEIYNSNNSLLTIITISASKEDYTKGFVVYLSDNRVPDYMHADFVIDPYRNDFEKIKYQIEKIGKKANFPFAYVYLIVFPQYTLFPKFYRIFKVKKNKLKNFRKEIKSFIYAHAESFDDAKIFTLNNLPSKINKEDILREIKEKNFILLTEKQEQIIETLNLNFNFI